MPRNIKTAIFPPRTISGKIFVSRCCYAQSRLVVAVLLTFCRQRPYGTFLISIIPALLEAYASIVGNKTILQQNLLPAALTYQRDSNPENVAAQHSTLTDLDIPCMPVVLAVNQSPQFSQKRFVSKRQNPTNICSSSQDTKMAAASSDRLRSKDPADQNFDYMFKLLIIGNSSVGKTSFLFRYSDDSFTSAFVSTVGIDFKVQTVFRNDKRIKLQIWDTGKAIILQNARFLFCIFLDLFSNGMRAGFYVEAFH